MEHETSPLRGKEPWTPSQVVLAILALVLAIVVGSLGTQAGEEGAMSAGRAVGALIGAILMAYLIYAIVRLIRGWKASAGMAQRRFLLITATVLLSINLLSNLVRNVGSSNASHVTPGQSNSGGAQAQGGTLPGPSDMPSQNTSTQSQNTQADQAVTLLQGWPLPPLTEAEWDDSGADAKSSRELTDAAIDSAPAEWRDTAQSISQIRVTKLPFFNTDAYLAEGLVQYGNRPAVYTFVVVQGAGVFTLTGDGTPIHQMDADGRLLLNTRAKAESYLRFFSAAVAGANGTFRIVDSADDLDWLPTATAEEKQHAAKYVRPLIISPAEDGGWKANATVQYASEIFSVIFLIPATGDVSMTEDFPLVSGLPLRHVTFRGPVRMQVGGMR